MTHKYEDPVQFIPINQINIVNTRSRGKEKFKQIISSIRKLGLKKPITVAPASGEHGPGDYDLVCGEGRLLAFLSLGEQTIPARVQSMSSEDLLLMSLVENLARRQARSAELLEEIAVLKKRGYKVSQIAAKTDLTSKYVSGILISRRFFFLRNNSSASSSTSRAITTSRNICVSSDASSAPTVPLTATIPPKALVLSVCNARRNECNTSPHHAAPQGLVCLIILTLCSPRSRARVNAPTMSR